MENRGLAYMNYDRFVCLLNRILYVVEDHRKQNNDDNIIRKKSEFLATIKKNMPPVGGSVNRTNCHKGSCLMFPLIGYLNCSESENAKLLNSSVQRPLRTSQVEE